MNRDILDNGIISFFITGLSLLVIGVFIILSFKAVWNSFPTDEEMKARKDLIDYCRSEDIKKLKVGDLPAKCLTFYSRDVL